MDTIQLVDIESSSGGAIKAGDQIVKIDKDDISTWTMMRGGSEAAPCLLPVFSLHLTDISMRCAYDLFVQQLCSD